MGTDIQESEDEGLSTFLELKDYMQTLKDKSRLNFPFSTKLKKEEDEDEEDETKKEFRSFFQKEFKITGKIGKPDSKDSLSYSSLIYQIESGFRKGYTESQIIDAIVSCVSHSNPLRPYLEGRGQLSLANMSRILRYHFKEQDATALFTNLSTAKQEQNESPQDFVMRLLNLRQKVIFVSKQENISYDLILVHKRFLHSIWTGLKNDNLRNELRELLKDENTSDEELLFKLSTAVADEVEHSKKFSKPKPVHSNNISVEKDKEKKNPLMLELEAMKVQINQISHTLSAISSLGKMENERERRNDYRNENRKMGCKTCVEKNLKNCDHCFYCGSSEHFKRGCKKRFNKGKQKNE